MHIYLQNVNTAKTRTHYSGLKIYPNPNNGKFIVETGLNTPSSVEKYDVKGVLMFSKNIKFSLNRYPMEITF